MKKLIGLILAAGLTTGAFAQSKVIRGNINPRPGSNKTTTVVVVPRAYNPYYNPYYGYRSYGMNPYGYYPRYGYGFGFAPQAEYRQPTKLDLEIEQIRSDYGHDISEARHDKSIGKSERKKRIREIKHERDNAIIAAKQAYYNGNTGRY
jgi:hypothetical protein